ncbi:MAG: metallophosphoesterase, partial [Verrucomicrobia bacterium]|nr:metallophosphoesterase [Verrucomicrobiota bacterium]
VFDVTNMIVIIMHVAAFLLIGDLAGYIIRKAGNASVKQTYVDIVALALCLIYLIVGWVLMHAMWESYYSLTTDKVAGKIRIAHIADSHVGTGFSGKGFGERLDKIQATNPDILVITGDFVDDSTQKQDMLDACEALSHCKSKYGIYYCLGNHDFGYYGSSRRGYTGEELLQTLRDSGVTVLQDESVLVDDRFYVIGRRDAGYGVTDRMPMSDLIADLDKDKYMIVLDHQPVDYDAQASSGVDLVLSGHTHGGQLFPLEYIQPLLSSNNNVRGYEQRGTTDFIVTDGISDWAIYFRTGCRSEYNLIDVTGK